MNTNIMKTQMFLYSKPIEDYRFVFFMFKKDEDVHRYAVRGEKGR